MREAFALFLQTHPHQRLNMAIELYRNKVVAVVRAAALAALDVADFRAILQARGLEPSVTGEAQAEPPHSSAQLLLKHAGQWAGDDLDQRLNEVYATRREAEF